MEMNNMLWQLIIQSDIVSKIVLIILFLMSVICWSILIYKFLIFHLKSSQLSKAYNLLENTTELKDFILKASRLRNNYGGEIIAHFLTDFKLALQIGDNKISSENEWNLLQTNMNQTVNDALLKEESFISVILTSAQISTLMGLFGTVWGLIHSFIGISFNKVADITAVAPGIAEALITTLAGLVVAIPALVMYNFLQGSLKKLEQNLFALMDRAVWIMRACQNRKDMEFSYFSEPEEKDLYKDTYKESL